MKKVIAGLLCIAATTGPVRASVEEVIVGALIGATVNEAVSRNRPNYYYPPNNVAYPVPVHAPQVIEVPRCSPNWPCPQYQVITCNTMPIFDSWGRITSYYKVCN